MWLFFDVLHIFFSVHGGVHAPALDLGGTSEVVHAPALGLGGTFNRGGTFNLRNMVQRALVPHLRRLCVVGLRLPSVAH